VVTPEPAPARSAGIPSGQSLHAPRHYYASLLIRHGESVKPVQARLGTPQRLRPSTLTATSGRTPTTALGTPSSGAWRPNRGGGEVNIPEELLAAIGGIAVESVWLEVIAASMSAGGWLTRST
jgi:hypothetical protein